MLDEEKRIICKGKTIREIHLGFVELLKARGEEVVQPRGKPMCITYGYDKTIGLISAGYIFYKKEDGTYDLLQDHLTAAYTGVKLENIGLCDARCWYEAIDDNRIKKANKEQAEKLTENKLMSSDFMVVSTRDKLVDAMKDIRKGSVTLFSSEAEQHRQEEKAEYSTAEIQMRAVLIAARKVINGDFQNQPDEYNIEVAVLNQIDEALAMQGTEQSEQELVATRVKPKPALAELCINIGEGEGQAVVSPDGKIEFYDTGLNISLRDLQFVVQEAEAYMKYREERVDAQTEAN